MSIGNAYLLPLTNIELVLKKNFSKWYLARLGFEPGPTYYPRSWTNALPTELSRDMKFTWGFMPLNHVRTYAICIASVCSQAWHSRACMSPYLVASIVAMDDIIIGLLKSYTKLVIQQWILAKVDSWCLKSLRYRSNWYVFCKFDAVISKKICS